MAFNPIKCGKCIANVAMDIQGHDPRGWIKSCAWQSVSTFNFKPSKFKKCLENKLRKEIKDLSNPEHYVEEIWKQIKGKCG